MLDAARDAVAFVQGKTRQDLDTDRLLSYGLVRAIEVIGEAASKVTSDGRALAPGIPWPSVTGMRNRIVHAYYDIDLDRVWDTVTDDLPSLMAELTQMLCERGDAPTP
jgi:uncharacterized protein with HEPN domain